MTMSEECTPKHKLTPQSAPTTMRGQGFSILVNQGDDCFDDEADDQCVVEQPRTYTFSISQFILICVVALTIGASIPVAFHQLFHTQQYEEEEPLDPVSEGQFDYTNNLRSSPPSLSEASPQLAWLMSFPNSGTSYTLSLTSAASNMTMASNYGWEHTGVDERHVPVISSQGAPFWLDATKLRPPTLALTKTHCGGYCHGCKSQKFTETPHAFMMHCATASSPEVDTEGQEYHEEHYYDFNYVNRAVHLIRDPFDNMVSRYHLALHQVEKKNNTDDLERYTYSAEGFANYCKDKSYEYDEQHSSQIDQKVLQLIQNVPCHMDLYRFVQWHNLAFITTQDMLNIPTLIVHYEDYETNFDETLETLLDFLELPNTGSYSVFEGVSDYHDYFSVDQRVAIRDATRMLASPILWHHLERYFSS